MRCEENLCWILFQKRFFFCLSWFVEWRNLNCFRGDEQVMLYLVRAAPLVYCPSPFDPNAKPNKLWSLFHSIFCISCPHVHLQQWAVVTVFSGAWCLLNKDCHWSWLRQLLSFIFAGFIPTTASVRTICSVIPSNHREIFYSSRTCF